MRPQIKLNPIHDATPQAILFKTVILTPKVVVYVAWHSSQVLDIVRTYWSAKHFRHMYCIVPVQSHGVKQSSLTSSQRRHAILRRVLHLTYE